ncbi:hypothetical protein [Rossellomorea sp. BNER]|uniref:hypothetical protein n=1 Tax=Rossellomorea sp. BNER TaxID=2962031 RepID=UPI003AF29FEB|nr:hypothetical protein [Rossellomorea sp. BNER]
MSAIFQYNNFEGKPIHKSWNPINKDRFQVLIKIYISKNGEEKPEVIEKPSTRPATIQECHAYVKKVKSQYGKALKQILIWDMEAIEETKKRFESGGLIT